jgi:hypothetical protein
MTTALNQAVPEQVQSYLDKHDIAVKIGDVFITDRGYYARIVGFAWEEGRDEYSAQIFISYWMPMLGNAEKWGKPEKKAIKDFLYYYRGRHEKWVRCDLDPDHLEENAYQLLDQVRDQFRQRSTEEAQAGTALLRQNTKESLELLAETVASRREMVLSIQRVVERRVRQAALMAESLSKELRGLHRIIMIGNLYLGVGEKITVLREGEPASIDSPVVFYQRLRYMDEECGIINLYEDKPWGIDFRSIHDFYDWLLSDSTHLDALISAPKGAVFLRPTDKRREYHPDPWINARINERNQEIIILIRNGQQLYTIETDLGLPGERTYPNAQEWQSIMVKAKAGDSYDADKAGDAVYGYEKTAWLLQGLLDRTEVFQPLPTERIDLFNLDSYTADQVLFARDDEITLAELNHELYKDWRERINAEVGQGSRIITSSLHGHRSTDRYANNHQYFLRWFYQDHSYPAFPDADVYEVIAVEEEDKEHYEPVRLHFLYNPGDEVTYGAGWEYDPHPRKNRVTFRLPIYWEEWLNYDALTIEEIDYFIHSRYERRDYLSMLPTLYSARKYLLAEQAREAEFVKLVVGRTEASEAQVWDAISWWKTKNKWKRGLSKDDAKALRMIERKLQQS